MKKFLIEFLINFVIVCITRIISDTYICGGIAGILCVYVTLFIQELNIRLKESDYYKVKEETKRIRKELKEVKRRHKALDEIIKLTKKYDLKVTRAEIQNEKAILIYGIMEESQC